MLTRVPEAEARLYDALRESFGRDVRTGVHLSSLLNPLKTYWDQRNGRPPLTDRDIGYFTAGRGHEDILTKLLATDFESTPEEEIDGIHLRPDFRAVTSRVIPAGEYAEFKTRRSNLPKTDTEAQDAFKSYRDQVRGYMALKRREQMYLIVLSLLEGKGRDPLSPSQPVIAVYRETMTPDELTAEWTELQNRKTLLELGVKAMLPLCPAWMCGKWIKQPQDAKDKFKYHPLCPHYESCQPQNRDPKRGAKREN
ncbi:MAG TPA: hypothetical protein VLA89_06700 [Gemmatimonadales bacterium]|nr:hypothetical protein [Gemmatimonadales bacterium]